MTDKLIRTNTYVVDIPSSLSSFLLRKCLFLHEKEDVFELLHQKRLLFNDTLLKSDADVFIDDVVTLLTPQKYEPKVCENIYVVYEDEFFFAINKPAHLPIHPTGKYYFNTLSSLIERNLGLSGLYPYNRLDRETSGIVLFSKTSEFVSLLQLTRVDKWYYALVFGNLFGDSTISEPLIKKTLGSLRHHMVVDPLGKEAKTSYEVISSNKKYSLLNVRLLTGRKHQIRVHLSYIGHPLVGDKEYGLYPDLLISHVNPKIFLSNDELVSKVKASQQLLHCHKVEFIHPKTSKLVSISVNVGEYFSNFLIGENIDLL